MAQEYKELLLKDLCARLPYHPKGLMINVCTGAKYEEWLNYSTFATFTATIFTSGINNCRLYLRPISSMTDEERKEYEYIAPGIEIENGVYIPNVNQINWLNAHHFDYRGLIEKGLAIAVTEENNPYKE